MVAGFFFPFAAFNSLFLSFKVVVEAVNNVLTVKTDSTNMRRKNKFVIDGLWLIGFVCKISPLRIFLS